MSALAAGAEVEPVRVLPPMTFMCGCRTGDNPSPSQIDNDSEGFVICATHRARRYGWQSIPRGRWELLSHSALVIEKFLVFGEPLPRVTVAL